MTTQKMLIKKILENAQYYDWSFLGLGMFRLHLSDEVRMQVWIESAQTKNVSLIHDHLWDFKSEVISGQITDHCYHEYSGVANYNKTEVLCGLHETGHNMPDIKTPVCLGLTSSPCYRAGNAYSKRAEELHHTEFESGTITIIKREFRNDRATAKLYYPIDEEFVSAEPRSATTEEINSMAAEALALLKTS